MLIITESLEEDIKVLFYKSNLITIIKSFTNSSNQNTDYGKRYQAETQKIFVDFQFRRSKLDKPLKLVD